MFLLKRFGTFDIDEHKLEEIKQSVALLNKRIASKMNEHKCSVIDNKVNFFEFPEIDIDELFNYIVIVIEKGNCN